MRKWAVVFLVVLTMAAGCSDEDSHPNQPADTGTLPESADSLMDSFVAVQEGMDLEALGEIVHPQARVFLLASTLQEWEGAGNPLTSDFFGRDDLLGIHGNIFDGQTGLDPQGNVIPPVTSLAFDMIEALEVWSPFEDPDGLFPDLQVQSRQYAVLLYFYNPDYHRFQVQVVVEFFATEVADGNTTGWQLLGWREFEPVQAGSSTESINWGDILTLYR